MTLLIKTLLITILLISLINVIYICFLFTVITKVKISYKNVIICNVSYLGVISIDFISIVISVAILSIVISIAFISHVPPSLIFTGKFESCGARANPTLARKY